MTGDTVLHRPLRRLAAGLDVDVAAVPPRSGPVPGSPGRCATPWTARDAVELVRLLEPRVAVPVHYEGWSHFSEPQDELHAHLDTLAPALRSRVAWLEPGAPARMDVGQ